MTFSIVARSPDGACWGVAVASKFLAVGNVVPAATAGVGALATQASANVGWKRDGLRLLHLGLSAEGALEQLVHDDEGRDHRQLGIVDSAGRAMSYTGTECLAWAGGATGPGLAVQGNILAGPQVVTVMKEVFEQSENLPFPNRLLAALAAGDAAGGDRRGRQSAALLVVRDGAGYGGYDDIAADLRIDDHPNPVGELGRLLGLNDLYLTASTESEKVFVDDALSQELAARGAALGHDDFMSWVGTENYEMRVAADGSWIDRRILAILRESTIGV
jgi:uncharacterized Ntn-hydrolase superfamily protein